MGHKAPPAGHYTTIYDAETESCKLVTWRDYIEHHKGREATKLAPKQPKQQQQQQQQQKPQQQQQQQQQKAVAAKAVPTKTAAAKASIPEYTAVYDEKTNPSNCNY